MGYGAIPFIVLADPWYFFPFAVLKHSEFLVYLGLVLNSAILYFAAARFGYARSSAKT